MSVRPIRPALLALLLAAIPLAAQRDASPFSTDRCPVPEGIVGYPVSVHAMGGVPLDSAFAAALAEAAARRWEPPSPGRRRNSAEGVQRLVPPEPRWPDDWAPRAEHVAIVAATLHRDGRVAGVEVVEGTRDRAFNNSLATIFDDPAQGQHPLPAAPADSVRVLVRLGHAPQPDDAATIRFAAQQTPMRVVPGSLNVVPPSGSRSPSALVKYDVSERGVLVEGSIVVLRRSDTAFGRAVEDGLRRARFTPAQANCRATSRSVVQQFGN